MPSEMMNPRGFSPSSFFHEEVRFSDERQVGARKVDHMTGYPGLKPDGMLRAEGAASSPLENRIPLDSQRAKGFGLPEYYLNRGRNVNLSFVGAERAASHSLPSAVDHDLGARTNLNMESASYFVDGDKINLMGAQYENGLFSSSLSDLFSRNLKLSSNNAAYGHSVGAAAPISHYDEEEAFESLEELEAQTIGNLLPDDDDLLSGVTDGFDSIIRPNNGEDTEDLDLFSSVGGLELGEESSNNQLGVSGGSNGEHPFGEHPSRTLFVRNINSNVEDSELQTLFEQYGDIRTLYTACKHRGFVMISYYDLRASRNAMKALQNKPLRRRKLDIHFSIPKENPSEKDINQGTVVVFNLDSSVSNDKLREIFGVYGEIKEIRETPHGSHHKFVEFYDVRAAESALRALNRSDIAGKRIILEAGQPGGSKRLIQPFSAELEQEESGLHMQHHSPPNNLASGFSGSLSFGGAVARTDIHGPRSTNGGPISTLLDNALHHGVSSSVPNSLPSLVRGEKGNQSSMSESGHLWNPLKFDLHGSPNPHPHSLPEYHDGLANGPPFGSPTGMAANISSRAPEMIDSQQFRRVNSNGQSIELNEVFGSSGNGSCPPPGRHYMWSNSHHSQHQAIMWPNSPQFVNGMAAAHPQQLHAVPRAPSHMMNALLPINNHHVGSAPSVNPSLWDRRHAYPGESPDATVFHPGSLGNMRISGNSPHPLEFVPHNIFPRSGGNGMDMPIPSKNIGLHPHQQRCMIFPARGQMLPMMNSLDSPNERTRNRRNEGSSSQADSKKQFELDLDRILRGEDKRTTLMIKNIPNNKYFPCLIVWNAFLLQNKCNVGYAFINMTEPSLIVPFYQTFNGKKWEKFNSEKVASLAYARIQGKSALIAHFQNSSLMNEDKRCRPILFHTDGPNAGDQVPFPMGSNIRPRPGKIRGSTSEESNQEIPPNSLTAEDYSNGDSSSGSGKDSD
ncbi:hypothetical protein BUALT_Bualt17G0008100 [Buddleja alternifolia]|uniref:RRM domain-containing protein n=1 Tax=Buddleja alternifolia TaxID=168488 RepID=A0AAV6WBB5_9LAMI|nr:hypothetical protein BUALT_Bualt17G0008100 [Buddleja alternifolia]